MSECTLSRPMPTEWKCEADDALQTRCVASTSHQLYITRVDVTS